MKFEGEAGLAQREIANAPEGKARRDAVFNALNVRPNQSVLDIGCGPGQLTKSFAIEVGQKGRSIGLDISEDQLKSARELCNNIAGAEIIQGDATELSYDDNTFDAISSIQTLEYIENVDTALSEINRVLRPGGKIALVSVLWDLWRFHGADSDLTNEMLTIWKGHCPHQMLPFELPKKLKGLGFNSIQQTPLPFLNSRFNENTYAFWAAKLVVIYAASQGTDQKKCDLWIKQLTKADHEERFGFGSVPVLTTAVG